MKFGAMVLAVCGVMHGFQAAPAKGSIEGQVMNLKAGTPLKKANVQLVMMNPGGAGAGRGQMPVRKAAETDEQGRFAFTGLDAGQVSVVGRAPGISAAELRRAQVLRRRHSGAGGRGPERESASCSS